MREHAHGRALLADTAYDSDAIRAAVRKRGMKAVIHPHPTRSRKRRLDRRTYAKRFLVECFFHRLKRFRALATRFEKTAKHYVALLEVAAAFIWLDDLLSPARAL